MRKVLFYAILWTPACAILTAGTYLFFLTNLPQLLYVKGIRNLPFDCLQFVPDVYIYKMKPEPCRAENIEYSVIATHDSDGFRLPSARDRYVAAVLGDSHAYGFGVADEETFSALLNSQYRLPTRNLGIGSYATLRELEVFKLYGAAANYVIIQYCDNDFPENKAALQLSEEQFRATVENWLNPLVANYRAGKSMGYKKPLIDLANMIRDGSYMRKSVWRETSERRPMEEEADVFAKLIARYRPFLENKKVLVFESAGYGLNSIAFARTFDSALSTLGWLRYKVLDSARLLDRGDYYFLDDHPNSRGHRKMASVIYQEIKDW